MIPRAEAERTDDLFTPAERDSIYNFLNRNGFSEASMRALEVSMKRSFKSIERQWELILYIGDKASIVRTYQPSPVRMKSTGPFTAFEREIACKHRFDRVPIHLTATILMRTVEEVQAFLDANKIDRFNS